MKTILQNALDLAATGFYVFPLRQNSKLPLNKGWQAQATRDPVIIGEYFADNNYNIGIFADKFGDNQSLVIIDVDNKPGKDGDNTMADHEAYGRDFPPTFKCRTASGGYHLFYTNPIPLQGGANKLGTHVDIKSAGGYVVGAGSTIDDKPYTWVDAANILDMEALPQWIAQRLGKPKERDAKQQAVETLDTPQQTARAIEYLANVAPVATKGAGRNNTVYQIAAKLKDYGISETYTAQLIYQHYNSAKCFPPYEFERIEIVTASAFSYGKEPAGISDPAADFDPISPAEAKALNPRRLYYRFPKDISPDFKRVALIKGVLDLEAMSVLYGESNTGKTFMAMDIAYHIAAGQPWDGKKTTQGNVLYIAAEGGRSAENRVVAITKHFNTTDFPLALVPCPINLLDSKADVKEIIDIVNEITEAKKEPVRLIVIDTLSRALAGGNENDSMDMGAFVKNIDAIRVKTKAHIMVVHHSGKDTAKGARGHSLLRAATDTELEVADKVVTTRKQRDMDFGTPTGFELKVIELGTDNEGDTITSCVIQKVDYSTFDSKASVLEPRDAIAFQALKECKTGRALREFENVIDKKTWAQCCKDYNFSLVPGGVAWPKSDTSFNQAFRRARDRLATLGLVAEVEKDQWVVLNERQPVAYATPKV